ncbi:hypothetical protein ACFYXV_01870 [Streptomyces sp. NPDC002181]|uniref:hypothetical protein n=1 Tax=Streptomyces sp. NPDC002181 TaxID=3364635 RepID=UPI0036ABEE66
MAPDTPAPQRDPFLEAVGRVTVAGALLDKHLHNLLGSIALEPTLLVYANADGTARLIELCELALTVGYVAPEDVPPIKECLVRARELKNRRNKIVHSIFVRTEDGPALSAMMPLRKQLGASVTAITIPEMEEIAMQIERLCSDIFVAGWNATSTRSGMTRLPQPAARSSEGTTDDQSGDPPLVPHQATFAL